MARGPKRACNVLPAAASATRLRPAVGSWSLSVRHHPERDSPFDRLGRSRARI